MKTRLCAVVGLTLLAAPPAGLTAQYGDFTYETSGPAIRITGYTGSGGAVAIPSAIDGLPVTIIATNAFYCEGAHIDSVSVPDSVIRIEDTAFLLCTLTNISIPDSVTGLGHGVFFGCTNLAGIAIPSRVPSIGNGVFFGCSRLASIAIPGSVTNIGNGSCYGCGSLAGITIPSSVTSLGNGVFAECGRLTSVFFQGNAPNIGSGVFSNDHNATIYYLPGATGWGPTFADRPTVLWTVGPIVRANLSRDDIVLGRGENLSILVQIIDSGQYAGIEVDWWIVARAGSDWYYLDSLRQWTLFDGDPVNCHPAYQGALFDLPITEIVNMPVTAGSGTFWFAVDYPMDGVLGGQMLVDSVSVNVH